MKIECLKQTKIKVGHQKKDHHTIDTFIEAV